MTTYLTHYILTDDEIPIYRRMLENWASIATGESIDIAERLIHDTYDADGNSLTKVEVRIRTEKFFPFWGVMGDELKRLYEMQEANRKLPFDERDLFFFEKIHQLEKIIEKLKANNMSSTYSGIARD